MDEKLDLEYSPAHQNPRFAYHRDMPNPRLPRSRRVLTVLLALLLPIYILFKFLSFPNSTNFARESSPSTRISLTSQNNASALVPLEAHVMSKCPDARDCLQDLVVPAMEEIWNKVDFRLSFIGT